MPRLALILALLLAVPVAADAVPPPPPTEKPHAPTPPAPPRGDEDELGEFVPSENVPADAAVAFPNDI